MRFCDKQKNALSTRDDCLAARPRSMPQATGHRFRLGTFCTTPHRLPNMAKSELFPKYYQQMCQHHHRSQKTTVTSWKLNAASLIHKKTTCLIYAQFSESRSEVSKLQPTGQMRPAKPFHPAREAVLSMMKKIKLRTIC